MFIKQNISNKAFEGVIGLWEHKIGISLLILTLKQKSIYTLVNNEPSYSLIWHPCSLYREWNLVQCLCVSPRNRGTTLSASTTSQASSVKDYKPHLYRSVVDHVN